MPTVYPTPLSGEIILPKSTDRKISIPILMRERAQGILLTAWAGAERGSPAQPCVPYSAGAPCLSCSQETTGTTSSRALLQAAAARSLAQALPVQRPFLLGPILSYSLASTCPFLSLQFHPVWNSLICVSLV